jgi:hypothetical protein
MHLYRIVLSAVVITFTFFSGCAALHICGPFESYEEGGRTYLGWQPDRWSALRLGVDQAKDQCRSELQTQCVENYVGLCKDRSDERFRTMSKAEADDVCAAAEPFLQEPGITCAQLGQRGVTPGAGRNKAFETFWSSACMRCLYIEGETDHNRLGTEPDDKMLAACMTSKGFKQVTKTVSGSCMPSFRFW